MKYLVLFGLAVLALLAIGGMPSGTQGANTKSYLPMIGKEPTYTPTVTPTPTPSVPHFQYRAYVQNQGWQDWRGEGQDAGTTGQALNIQAFQFKLTSGPANAQVRYRAHVSNIGWMAYQTSTVGVEGGVAGTTNTGNQIEAIQVGFDNMPGYYTTTEAYVADWGWIGWARDFWIVGTTSQNRRLEAFHAGITNTPQAARIRVAYNGRLEGSTDYDGWRHDGEQAGTTGQSKRLEMFKAVLFQRPENMTIQYRCNIQDSSSWTDFMDQGGECGQIGKAINQFEMRLSNAYTGTVLSYSGHFANIGTQSYASDNPGQSNPVVGNGTRLEAMTIGIGNQVAAAARAASGLPAPLGRP